MKLAELSDFFGLNMAAENPTFLGGFEKRG
jgi:hypothetical protein